MKTSLAEKILATEPEFLRIEDTELFLIPEKSYNKEITNNLLGYKTSIGLHNVNGFGVLYYLIEKFKDLYESSMSINMFLKDIVDYAGVADDVLIRNSPYLDYSDHATQLLELLELNN
jgi:hypothetical protein